MDLQHYVYLTLGFAIVLTPILYWVATTNVKRQWSDKKK